MVLSNETTLLSPTVNSNNNQNYAAIAIPTTDKTPEQQSIWRHHRELLVVTLAGIAYTPLAGVVAYSSPALPLLQTETTYSVSPENGSWFSSLGSLGAAVGTLLGGPLANWLGRKYSLIFTLLSLIFSWLIMLWSTSNLWVLLLGRLLTGIFSGTLLVIIPTYIAEITSADRRGTYQCITSLIYQLGYVFIYLVGAFSTFRWLTFACLAHVTVATICIFPLPESPRWLLSRNRLEESESALKWVRQSNNVFLEFNEIKNGFKIATIDGDNRRQLDIRSPKVYKPLLLSLGLMVILVSTGIDVILFYTVEIFQQAKIVNGSTADPPSYKFDPFIETVVVGISGVFGVLTSSYFVDKCGRRPILMVSGALIVLPMAVIGIYFKFLDSSTVLVSQFSWIPVVCLIWFIFSYNVGWGSVPYALSAEMLPTEARALGTGLCFTVMWILGFAWTKCFILIQMYIGTSGMFWVFSASGFIGVLFVAFLIPETKGKTLEQIEHIFRSSTCRESTDF